MGELYELEVCGMRPTVLCLDMVHGLLRMEQEHLLQDFHMCTSASMMRPSSAKRSRLVLLRLLAGGRGGGRGTAEGGAGTARGVQLPVAPPAGAGGRAARPDAGLRRLAGAGAGAGCGGDALKCDVMSRRLHCMRSVAA